MSSLVERLKENILTLYRHIRQEYKHLRHLRFAIVTYTDYDFDESNRGQVIHFSNAADIGRFVANVQGITIPGTGCSLDQAEDVMSGLNAALTQLKWRGGADKLLIHMADAPCHGRTYHDPSVGDLHRDVAPNGRPHEEFLEELMEEVTRKRIRYVFGKLNSSTDMMIQAFNKPLLKHSRGQLSISTFNVEAGVDEFVAQLKDIIVSGVEATCPGPDQAYRWQQGPVGSL